MTRKSITVVGATGAQGGGSGRSILLVAPLLIAIAGCGTTEANPWADYTKVLPEVLAKAIPVDQKKGIATVEVKSGVYVVTDGIWQSAFITTGEGVIVLDAPESYAAKLPEAISAVTKEPVRVLIYTHAHKDHIGGSAAFSKVAGLRIIALESVKHFLAEKNDPNRLLPTETFAKAKTLEMGSKRLELKNSRNYHSDEGDLLVYLPKERFLMAVDTLAPGYVPFMSFDLTSNFHEYMKVFDDILAYDFDVFVGGHLTSFGKRKDVEETKDYVLDVYRTTKKIHTSTDMMAVMAKTAEAAGGWENKYLLFRAFLDKVTEDSAKEIRARWSKRLSCVDVFVESHVRTALVYIRWDD